MSVEILHPCEIISPVFSRARLQRICLCVPCVRGPMSMYLLNPEGCVRSAQVGRTARPLR